MTRTILTVTANETDLVITGRIGVKQDMKIVPKNDVEKIGQTILDFLTPKETKPNATIPSV